MHASPSFPLRGRTALVTGVSRRRGIGFAVARTLASRGASVFLHHFRPHDVAQPWGGDDLDEVRRGIEGALVDDALLGDASADLTDAARIPLLLDAAFALTGRIDIVVCNHARSGGDGGLVDLTAERLDGFWDANARSSLLLTAEYARRVSGADAGRPRTPGERGERRGPFETPRGRVFWMTSGQIHGPMRGEVAYATSKAALAGITATAAAELLDEGIVLNTIDPGPVNTGYLDPETTDRSLDGVDETLAAMPFGRFGRPEDPAELIGWLASDAGSWVVGQVLTSDGGFSLRG